MAGPSLLDGAGTLPSPTAADLQKLLTPTEAAKLLGTTSGALATRRHRGLPPTYVRLPHSKRVYYLAADIAALVRASRRTSTRDT